MRRRASKMLTAFACWHGGIWSSIVRGRAVATALPVLGCLSLSLRLIHARLVASIPLEFGSLLIAVLQHRAGHQGSLCFANDFLNTGLECAVIKLAGTCGGVRMKDGSAGITRRGKTHVRLDQPLSLFSATPSTPVSSHRTALSSSGLSVGYEYAK